MTEHILVGRGKEIARHPAEAFRRHLESALETRSPRLAFMTREHHLVRDRVVTEIPRVGTALAPELIAEKTGLELGQVAAILDDLESHLFFLVRNRQGEVSWAFPVTSEPTSHRLELSTGETTYAAWAEDAVPTPFVQGCLRNESVSATLRSRCARSGRSLTMKVDGLGDIQVLERGASPLLFEPQIDWERFRKPNIIDDFWRNSLFFWSEDEARAFRNENRQVDGTYLDMAQAGLACRVGQASLFDIDMSTGKPRRPW
jgi:hypothetical protein